jgi:hypothetical protein
MTLVPIASFLAGSLLSLLLPTLLLIALVVWYLGFFRRVPDTPEPPDSASRAAASEAAPSASPPDDPGQG